MISSHELRNQIMPNKELNRNLVADVKAAPAVQNAAPSKPGAATTKASIVKTATKECAMSPGAAPAEHASELLGSLTTQQQQRTSARVIKKLRLEPPAPDPDKRTDIPECDTPSKIDENPKFPTVKQRMPKALWSADEKSLFFEALNEYGKDFDAITAHICAKMKKKGMPDINLKTKTQVSHFYYRTWHKLSKHVHFGENVKKVAQELYALINYGELRKKLVSVSEKTCARLHEMVLCGSMVVRHRGRNLRARTPMCRALRRLNQITDRSMAPGPCALAQVSLRARCAAAWARVQAAAHNPRAAAALPPRAPLAVFLAALERRWRPRKALCKPKLEQVETETEEAEPPRVEENEEDLEEHLNLEPDRMIVQEQQLGRAPALHVGPRAGAAVRLPVVRASEQLSSQKICFSSYLQRSSQANRDCGAKIRTPKRHRKDSSTEKEKEAEQKKPKLEDEPKLLDIDETAVDGIELMANYKTHQEDEEKPSTEDEKEIKAEETAEEEGERDKYMSEREKDSFSEMEDDEKYNKSDSDNESDHKDKGEKDTKFKNLKVKFRIRPKKRGGSIYTLVTEKVKEKDGDEPKVDEPKEDVPDIDEEKAIAQIRKGWSVYDAGDLTIGDLYLMFGSRSKLDLDYWWAEPTPPLPKPKELEISPPSDKRLLERTPDKGTDSSLEDERERERRESDSDIFSPKAFGQDSNDALSGDEKKTEPPASSPERKPARSLSVASKLLNRPAPPPAPAQVSDRLKRLLALAGNPHASAAPARCACPHVCGQPRKPVQGGKQAFPPPCGALKPAGAGAPVFRHPTPIAPKPTQEPAQLSLAGVPRWRRGRPRAADRRVVVQRLLPLLPKLPPPNSLIPVKIGPSSPPAPPRILPRPPPTTTADLSFFYVLSESNGQFFFHDGDRRIPISPLHHGDEDEDIQDEDNKEDIKLDLSASEAGRADEPSTEPSGEPNCEPSGEPCCELADAAEGDKKNKGSDMTSFLPAESSLSLSPSRLLAGDGWLAGAAHDFSLSSFLGQLEPAHAVDSHLQSLMAESSVDYVAKFADLAAEVSDERPPLT